MHIVHSCNRCAWARQGEGNEEDGAPVYVCVCVCVCVYVCVCARARARVRACVRAG